MREMKEQQERERQDRLQGIWEQRIEDAKRTKDQQKLIKTAKVTRELEKIVSEQTMHSAGVKVTSRSRMTSRPFVAFVISLIDCFQNGEYFPFITLVYHFSFTFACVEFEKYS